MSKIINLEATNYKGLRAVSITPDGHMVNITGRNAQGKSSILDAISAAFSGASSKNVRRPIRDGEDSAEIIVTTDDVIVRRTFKDGKTAVKVTDHDGRPYPKPQEKLSAMIGKLSLDPIAFVGLSDRDQLNALLDLVDLPFDPAKLEAERAKVFTERTDVNRRVKELQGQAAQYTIPADVPAEEVSVSALLTQYREAEKAAADQAKDRHGLANATREIEAIDQQIRDLQERRAEWVYDGETWAAKIAAHPELPDLEAIQSQIDTAEQVNSNVRMAQGHRQILERLTTLQGDADFLTAQLAAIEKRKAEGLAAATFPVDGLGFDTDGVTFGGVPFKDACSAEQIRVSLGMAMALDPELRVIRIKDGALLDAESFAIVAETAERHDFQIWIETVSNGDGIGWLIEDGSVAA